MTTHRSNRRLLVLTGSLLIVALALGACGGPSEPTPAPAAATQPPVAATPVPSATTTAPAAADTPTTAAPAVRAAGSCGTLNILYWQAATILNTHLSQGEKDYDAGRLILEPLAAWSPRGEIVPVLAAEIPTVDNGELARDFSSVTWKLKPGVKWSDGTDFTADDVVFTWQYVADPKTASPDAASVDNIRSVDKIDDTTVRITWKAPNPNAYETFVGWGGTILQQKQFGPYSGAKSKDGPNLAPIGTGPFMVAQMKPNDVVTYDMNPNYRDFVRGKPCFKSVVVKGGGDAPSAAKAVFQTGETDYAWNLQVEAAVLMPMANAADSRGVLATIVGPNLERIALNETNPDPALGDKRSEPPDKGGQAHPFLSDPNVRKALAMVINTQVMAQQLYGPSGNSTCLVLNAPPKLVSKGVTCSAADDAADATANKLLDDAGWGKGADGIRHKTFNAKDVRMHIVYQTTVNALRQKEQAFVKDAWSKLGVETELKSVQAGVFFSNDLANPDTAAKLFADVEMYTSGAASPDPTNYLKDWTCGEIKTKDGQWSGTNVERWCNPAYDAIVDQLKKETDAAKRTQLAIQAQDLLVNNVVNIPVVSRNSVSGYSKALKGIDANGAWDSDLWNIADWSK